MNHTATFILGIVTLAGSLLPAASYAQMAGADDTVIPTLHTDSEVKRITDYLALYTPSSLEANPANTRTPFGQTGLGVLIFGLTDKNISVNYCNEKVTMHYSETPDGEKTLLRSLQPGPADGGLLVMGAQLYDDYSYSSDSDFSDNPAFYVLYMFFASQDDSDSGLALDKTRLPLYKKEGYYTVTIPDGAFKLNDGTLIAGAQFTYHYDATEAPRDLSYEVSPAPNTTVDNAAELFGWTAAGIRVDFTGARQIDYKRSGTVAKVTMPDGTEIKGNAPAGGGSKRYLSFTFGTRRTDWSQQGEYQFEVMPDMVGIDQGEYDEWENDGTVPNFPGCKALYVVDDSTGVFLPGVVKADRYDVVRPDGTVVVSGGDASALARLSSGVYIINGRKVRLR